MFLGGEFTNNVWNVIIFFVHDTGSFANQWQLSAIICEYISKCKYRLTNNCSIFKRKTTVHYQYGGRCYVWPRNCKCNSLFILLNHSFCIKIHLYFYFYFSIISNSCKIFTFKNTKWYWNTIINVIQCDLTIFFPRLLEKSSFEHVFLAFLCSTSDVTPISPFCI